MTTGSNLHSNRHALFAPSINTSGKQPAPAPESAGQSNCHEQPPHPHARATSMTPLSIERGMEVGDAKTSHPQPALAVLARQVQALVDAGTPRHLIAHVLTGELALEEVTR